MKKLLILLVPIVILGCSGNNMADDGLSSADKQAADRLTQIAKTTGGDWSKVSESDKDYLVNQIAHGSEQTAKMLLQSKAGKMSGGAGGK